MLTAALPIPLPPLYASASILLPLTCIIDAKACSALRTLVRGDGFGKQAGTSTVETVLVLIGIRCAVIDVHRRAAGRLQAQVGDVSRPVGSGADVGEGVAIHVNICKFKALRQPRGRQGGGCMRDDEG